MPSKSLQILYEDNHLLVVNKPAGLPTMGVAAGDESLVVRAKQYLKQKYRKPGNVYLGVVSRLDASASGVIVLARTSKAAARLTRAFEERRVEKNYWAVAAGKFRKVRGTWEDFVRKNERLKRMEVCDDSDTGARRAVLDYLVLEALADCALLEISLHTGRKHQIRLQCAHRGHPLLGDRKYGSRQLFGKGIALHSRRLVLEHPVQHTEMTWEALPPRSWASLGFEFANS
jgi:RluA family pseudouridine synthase